MLVTEVEEKKKNSTKEINQNYGIADIYNNFISPKSKTEKFAIFLQELTNKK